MTSKGFSAFSPVITTVAHSKAESEEKSCPDNHHSFTGNRYNASLFPWWKARAEANASLFPWWKARAEATGLSPAVWSFWGLQHPSNSPYLRFAPYSSYDREKPSQSYIGLIAEAILSSPEEKLILSDIYGYILANYPYFRSKGTGWRNSVRHNLSLNECFVKAGRSPNGKGHFWAIGALYYEDFRRGDFRRRRTYRRNKGKRCASEGNAATEREQGCESNVPEELRAEGKREGEEFADSMTTEIWNRAEEKTKIQPENSLAMTTSLPARCVGVEERLRKDRNMIYDIGTVSMAAEKSTFIDMNETSKKLAELTKDETEAVSPMSKHYTEELAEENAEQSDDSASEITPAYRQKSTGFDVASLLAPDREHYGRRSSTSRDVSSVYSSFLSPGREQRRSSTSHDVSPVYSSLLRSDRRDEETFPCATNTVNGIPSLLCEHCYPFLGVLASSQRDMRHLYQISVGTKVSLPPLAYSSH